MLPELDRVGVHGLALLAGGLRKPIAVDRPLHGPDDWRGITFAAFRSDTHAAAIRALGATPTDVFANDLSTGLGDGTIHGFEKNLLVYSLNVMAPDAPHVTLNVNLWPETVVLLVNPQALGRLTEAQQGWVRQAAADASARSSELADVDQELLADLCRLGARFSTASPADLAALRAAMTPVYADLEQDPGTAASLSRIEELKRSVDAGELRVPDGCADRAG
jgi:TRAP-type C4-dicarboxylate transport system substrate-binding protein